MFRFPYSPEDLNTEGLVATPLDVPGAMGGEPTDDAIQKATMEMMETISRGFVSKKERVRWSRVFKDFQFPVNNPTSISSFNIS